MSRRPADSLGALPVRWRSRYAGEGRVPSPIVGVDSSQAYVAARGEVRAFDLATGAFRWRTGGLDGQPIGLLSDGVQVVTAGTVLTALGARTGKVLWSVDPPADITGAAPVADAVSVFAGSIQQAASTAGSVPVSVLAYDRAHGELRWVAVVGSSWEYRSGVRGLTVADGVLYAVATQCTNVGCGTSASWVIALNPMTGAEQWRLRLGEPNEASLVVRPLTVAGGVLFASDHGTNSAVAIDIRSHRIAWHTRFRSGYAGPTDPPRVDMASRVAYVGSGDTYLYALDATTGAKQWEVKIGGSIFATALCGGAVITQDLSLRGVRIADRRRYSAIFGDDSDFANSNLVVAQGLGLVGTTKAVVAVACP